MEKYVYIVQQIKKAHFSGWDDEVLRECVEMLPSLTSRELSTLYYHNWLKNDKKFRDCVFNALYADKIGKREERIKNLETAALIEEFKDKKSGNVSLIRSEMQNRYKEGKDCEMIAEAFNASNEKDQQWVKSQERHSE